MRVAIDNYVPHSIIRDLTASYDRLPSTSVVRMYRIPVEDFSKAIERVITGNASMPFRPTLMGLPVDMSEKSVPECVVVYDDNTNAAVNGKKENEV